MRGKKKFLIAGLLLVVAMGILFYRGLVGAGSYYLRLDELAAQEAKIGDAFFDQRLKIGGVVQDGSIVMDNATNTVKFVIADGNITMPVVYDGNPPVAGNEVVCEGKLSRQGIFQADSLISKCPSKYEAATTTPAKVTQ